MKKILIAVFLVTLTMACVGCGGGTGANAGGPSANDGTTRIINLSISVAGTEAVVLVNSQPTAATFELTHNGHRAFATMDEILDVVRSMPDEIPAERFERKLWRFVRDNTYHYPPVNAEQWTNAIWPTVNSFGWGFCSNVSAVFLQIAEAAGYQARIWDFNGHVVPEIVVDGRWQMFDPDLAVYYHDDAGNVAGVEELMAEPTLISSPIGPILRPGTDRGAYSTLVADIYGSIFDNTDATTSSASIRFPAADSRFNLVRA